MNTLTYVLIVAVYTHGVYCSYYHGPTAKPEVLDNGYLADTHDVATAKNAHLAALAKESHHGHGVHYGYSESYRHGHDQQYSGSYGGQHEDYRYHGPITVHHVLHNGHISDTHELAAAKAEHFTALAKAKSQGEHGDNYSNIYASGYGVGYGNYHHVVPYHGPLANPVVIKSGYLSDTQEVSAAKAGHFAAVANAKAHGGCGDNYNDRYASGYSADHGHYHHVLPYHGPLAKPVVLKSGYLADTHEVSAAKAGHFEAVANAKAHGGYGDSYSGRYASGYSAAHGHHHHVLPYHGPLAKPVVLKSGYLADTHEVAAAKAGHFAAVANAKAHGGYGDNYSGRYASGYSADHGHYHHVLPYHGPLATPVVLKSGYLQDTHEVAAARHHYLKTLHKAGHHGNYHYHY